MNLIAIRESATKIKKTTHKMKQNHYDIYETVQIDCYWANGSLNNIIISVSRKFTRKHTTSNNNVWQATTLGDLVECMHIRTEHGFI